MKSLALGLAPLGMAVCSPLPKRRSRRGGDYAPARPVIEWKLPPNMKPGALLVSEGKGSVPCNRRGRHGVVCQRDLKPSANDFMGAT